MLLSFDIDETLFYQHKHQEKLKLTQTVALQIIKHLINGDIILINTANTNKAKTAYIVADLLQTISLRDKQNKPLFDENAKEEFIKALNSNFYVSLAIGCEVYKLNVPSYEKLKTFDVLDQLLYSVKLTDCLYKKGISNETMQRVKQILEDDEYFSQKIDMNRWGYLDYKCIRLPFPRGMVSVGYNEDLPTVSRPCIKS